MASDKAGASAPLIIRVQHSGEGAQGASAPIRVQVNFIPAETDKTGGFFFPGN